MAAIAQIGEEVLREEGGAQAELVLRPQAVLSEQLADQREAFGQHQIATKGPGERVMRGILPAAVVIVRVTLEVPAGVVVQQQPIPRQ